MRTAVDKNGVRHCITRFNNGAPIYRADGERGTPVYMLAKCGGYVRNDEVHWAPWEPDEGIAPDCDDCIRRRDLAELVGMHVLDARGEWVLRADERCSEDAMVACVRLDGVLYEFKEDPSDGYRSGLEYARVIEPEVVPAGALAVFPPVVVEARLCTNAEPSSTYRDASDEILYLVRESDGATIMTVGTDNLDDYYPSFVHRWSPEGFQPTWLQPQEDPNG